MEVPKSTPIAALFLELGILPIQYEIEKRQLVFFKRILDRENDDLIKMSYHEMLKYQAERNWANNVHELRGKYNLPLNDENVCNLTYAMWKKMIHDRVKYVAFSSLTEMCSANKKICLLSYDKLIKAPYLTSFKPEIARMVFRARVGIYDIKKILRKSMTVNYPVPFVDNLLSSLSTYSSATQGFFVRRPSKGQHYMNL